MVYGEEDPGVPEASVNCHERIEECRAVCCTFQFALTKEEVRRGNIKHNPARPFFIAREPDAYCPHLDRKNLRCGIWEE